MLSSDNIQCFFLILHVLDKYLSKSLRLIHAILTFLFLQQKKSWKCITWFQHSTSLLYEYASIQVSMIGMTQQISFYKICKFHINILRPIYIKLELRTHSRFVHWLQVNRQICLASTDFKNNIIHKINNNIWLKSLVSGDRLNISSNSLN